MSVGRAQSVEELLSIVRSLRKRWTVPRHHELWFRAEDAKHRKTKLRPMLFRPRKSGKMKSVKALLELEHHLFEEFRRCATQLSDVKLRDDGDDDWPWYFLMQHHGAPTRLLDWSDGALVALHFAIREKTAPIETGAVIYVLDPHWLVDYLESLPDYDQLQKDWNEYRQENPEESRDDSPDDWDETYLPGYAKPLAQVPLLWDSPHVTRRIAAQRSRFMIFGQKYKWLAELSGKKGAHLHEIMISASAINGMKLDLRDAGMTESVIFPDLDGLGRETRQVFESRR
jgi:FRG domain